MHETHYDVIIAILSVTFEFVLNTSRHNFCVFVPKHIFQVKIHKNLNKKSLQRVYKTEVIGISWTEVIKMSKSSVKRKIEHSADHQGEVTKCKGNDLEERKQTKNSTGHETRETRGSLKKGSDQDAGQSGVSSSKKMRKNVTSARIVEDNEYVTLDVESKLEFEEMEEINTAQGQAETSETNNSPQENQNASATMNRVNRDNCK